MMVTGHREGELRDVREDLLPLLAIALYSDHQQKEPS